jgi:sugar lactone lactonase YvrE
LIFLRGLAAVPTASAQQSGFEEYTFLTLAGPEECGAGAVDGSGSAARFNGPSGVVVDGAGNVFVVDGGNYTVRAISPNGAVTTLAGWAGESGNTDGAGGTARFSFRVLFVTGSQAGADSAGNVYVADTWNHTIRKIARGGAVTTLAGLAGERGSADGLAAEARFLAPCGVALDRAGNVFVADTGNQTIRKISPQGIVTTVAGQAGSHGRADGKGGVALFDDPSAIAVDNAGNLYVADTMNNTIRKITPDGAVSTLAGSAGSSGSADGKGSAARFDMPGGIALDGAGNLYVADISSSTIRKISPEGVVTTVAGQPYTRGSVDGTGKAARFSSLRGVAVDSAGNVYVADAGNNSVRKMTPEGVVTTIAGRAVGQGSADGPANAARFNQPSGLTLDSAGSVYVADTSNYTIRKIGPESMVTTLAGRPGSPGNANGTGSAARFSRPSGIVADNADNLYVTDSWSHTVRKVDPRAVVTTLAGVAMDSGSTDGTSSAARFTSPFGLAADGAGNLYVADQGNSTIRMITAKDQVTTVAGLAGERGSADGTAIAARFNEPLGLAADSAGNVYVADASNHILRKISPEGFVTTLAGQAGTPGSADGVGSAARFRRPASLAVGRIGDLSVYVADSWNHTIRKISPDGTVTTLAGQAGSAGSADGTGSAARFNEPFGIAVDNSGNVYVAESWNHTIRKVRADGVVTTLAGLAGQSGSADGTGSEARFNIPQGIAVDIDGNVYVADYGNSTIRKVGPGGEVMTLAGLARQKGSADGTGSAARFYWPYAVALGRSGNLYVADSGNYTVRMVIEPTGEVRTVAGAPGQSGSADGTADMARFYYPKGITVDRTGKLYVADSWNNTIRQLLPAPAVITLAGAAGQSGSADGTGSVSRFNRPAGVAADSRGNLYVADTYSQTIRKIGPGGVVTTLAGQAGERGSADGSGSTARFSQPSGVAADGLGNVYVADSYNHTVRKVDPRGLVTTIGGQAGKAGSANGTGSTARFNLPLGIALDRAGNLYIADSGNSAIRLGTTNVCPDRPAITTGQVQLGTTLQLETKPQTATSWQWSIIRRPTDSTAELSSTTVCNPTFTPDVADVYVLRLFASNCVTGAVCLRTLEFTVLPASASFRLAAPQRLPDGGFALSLMGGINRTYALEISTDLTAWSEWTNVTLTSSSISLTDAGASNQVRRFYRARAD